MAASPTAAAPQSPDGPKTAWHALSIEETYGRLSTGPEGLNPEEAAARLSRFGPNTLREAGGTSPWRLLLSQFSSLLIIILLIAAAVSAFLGEGLDAVVIFAIVILSAGVGFFQERRAEQAIQALKRMAAPLAEVIRGGSHMQVPSAEVVPGDVVVLHTGDRIPADCRLTEAASLSVDEAALTGESMPVRKDTAPLRQPDLPLGDRLNMGHMATVVSYGRGRAVVVATGMETEFGRIAELIQETSAEKTPLEARLNDIGKGLAGLALAVCAAGAAMGVLKGYPVFDMFLWGVSLAVAAVPEALPAVVTGALAIGARRMARRHAVVKRLPAVETLGSTTVICTDKTGTLTRNEMTVRKAWASGRLYDVGGTGYDPRGAISLEGRELAPAAERALRLLAEIGLNCNDASLRRQDSSWRIVGDPTEGALLTFAHKLGLAERCGRDFEVPFESERKRMSVVCPTEAGFTVYTKGAPEAILACCTHIMIEGEPVPLSAQEIARVAAVAEGLAAEALRVLGFAFREVAERPGELPEEVERELVFAGLQAMLDPPREEVKAAIARCLAAGIKPVMVTGDHRSTAAAIARELGLLREGLEVVSGEELARMSDAELAGRVEDIAVYARVSPEHKLRIVNAFKERGEVVAMTGDGVNDAPALKRADIGIAMGITGTDVTKEAADMILTDDNFATIVAAVEEGRAIYDNIKKYLVFLLSCNIAEVAVLVGAFFLGLPLPLIAIQILWVNLTTDGLPALALGVDPADPGIMARPPRRQEEPVFDRQVVVLIGVIAAWITAVLLPLFNHYVTANPAALKQTGAVVIKAQTVVFASMILFELANAYNCRSVRFSAFKAGVFGNRWLNPAVLISAGLMFVVIQVPALDEVFHTSILAGRDWALVVPLSLTIIPVVEGAKWTLVRLYGSSGTA
jgi:Ca2+-transporting ATPase